MPVRSSREWSCRRSESESLIHQDRRDAILKGTGINVFKDTNHTSQLKAAWWELNNTERLYANKLLCASGV